MLAPMGVEFEAVGAVGRLGDTIQTTVRDRAVTRVYVAAPRRTVWRRCLGIHGLTATLAGVLPVSVTVVPVDIVDGETDAAGGAAFADVRIDPHAPVGK